MPAESPSRIPPLRCFFCALLVQSALVVGGMGCDNGLLVSTDREDIFDALREELRLSREQRERSEARYAELQAASGERHAGLQREVLESNRMVMRRMDGLVKENQAVLRENSAAIRENTATLLDLRETIGDLRGLAKAHTMALFEIFDRLPPPNEAAA